MATREEQRARREKQIKIKELLKKQLESRKKQLSLFNEWLKPLKDNIKILEETIKGRESLKHYINHAKYVNQYYKLLENLDNDKTEEVKGQLQEQGTSREAF